MRLTFPAIAAALLCCLSCVEINTELGGSLIPVDQTYTIHPTVSELPYGSISQQLADSLSGFSLTRITIGAIRDSRFGLTTRSCAMTLVPENDTLDFGNVASAKIRRFRFTVALDTVSVASENQRNILQNVRVHALEAPIRVGRDYDSNGNTVKVDYSKSIATSIPVVNGTDSLVFDFSEEFARRVLSLTQDDLKSFSSYTSKIPGIHLSTDIPVGEGGRISIFELQTGYNSDLGYVTGNYARLDLSCDYDFDGKPEKDTSFYFLPGLMEFTDVDSLVKNGTRGSYPEYCLNLTGHETRAMEGLAEEEVAIEGGGGLKPVISALELKHLAESLITAEGGDPRKTVINKASLKLPFRFPDDYRDMDKYPYILSPTCRIRQNDSTVVFAGLTDATSSDENQGTVNRSTLRYEPDITYHLQELLKIHETEESGETENDIMKRRKLLAGEYDIWLIITAHEVTKVSNSTNSSMSDYYQMLMYQQYYNNMYYGGYGYGGYGYGGYGYDSYSNYYNYYLMASLYANSGTSETAEDLLDKDRYYSATLYGPKCADRSLRPTFELTFSIPGADLE